MSFSCHAAIIIGAEQSGKSTFIKCLLEIFEQQKRHACAVNIDPSTDEDFGFPVIDIRSLYDFKDFLNEYGPKRALNVCMDIILNDEEWFTKHVFGNYVRYMMFDIPNEMDVLLQVRVLPRLIQILHSVQCSVCIVYLLDSQFVLNPFQYVGGYLYSMSNIASLGVPHINFLTKCDLLNENQIQDLNYLSLNEDDKIIKYIGSLKPNIQKMTEMIYKLINCFNFGRFIQFDISDPMNVIQNIKILDEKLGYVPNKEEEEEAEDAVIDLNEEEDGLVWPKVFLQ